MARSGPAAALLLAGLATICPARPATAETVTDAWSMLAERSVLAECEIGSQPDQWARRYSGHRPYLQRVLERATPWIGFITEELERRGLPGELALLPVAESSFDPFAYSPRDASGMWQLLAATARHYGLEINQWYDGRRDIYAATPAALQYLEELHAQLGRRWDLAIAAYNAGPGRVRRALQQSDRTNGPVHWSELSLPGETRFYLSRILGLSCLLSHPQRYGFTLPPSHSQEAFAVIDIDGPIDIVAFATAAGLQPEEVLEFNPGLRGLFTSPTGPHHVLVPASARAEARQAANTIPASPVVTWSHDNERRGDTLTGLARRHNASPPVLKKLNNLEQAAPEIGQHLLIPPPTSQLEDPDYSRRLGEFIRLQARLLPEKRNHHRVRPGEDLWTLSQRYIVPIDTIRRVNGLSPDARIRTGQMIEIPPGGLALRANQYRVQTGDTLWSIARDHGLSISELKALNTIPAGGVLKPGEILNVGDDQCCEDIDRFVSP